MKLKRKIFFSTALACMITLLLSVIGSICIIYFNFSAELQNEVKNEALYIGQAVDSLERLPGGGDELSLEYLTLAGQLSESRISYILSDGTVAYDNYYPTGQLQNHAERPEIIDALENGSGEITRLSDTLGNETYYYALRLQNGDVLRIASETQNVLGFIGNAVSVIVAISILIIIMSLLMAYALSRSVIKPIVNIDLANPLENNTYAELSPLLIRMQHQNGKIARQIEQLLESKNDFDYITSNMNEGFVILSETGKVLFINSSAEKTLSDNLGGTYPELYRGTEFIRTVETALNGKKADCTIERDGRIYSISANPVVKDSDGCAAVLFIVDITDHALADKMRREFSANVSHELKTPLTSIMGYAEIIGNGIAKPEDIPVFAEKIHTESSRLLNLIQDIIRLSQLDEGAVADRFELVSLSAVCKRVTEELRHKAEKLGVTLAFEGSETYINGFEPVLHEMIYNLCDNAIMYNKQGGTASVRLASDAAGVTVAVSDTGIGIPPEHQQRIFERFYRVDKSRSKETGGTGLGLSIVNHGAKLHGAKLALESKAELGTTITLVFPTE